TEYTATVTTGAKDLAGNGVAADVEWKFTTGTTLDTNPPTVVSVVPSNSGTDISVNDNISATFSETMDIATMIPSNFTIEAGGTSVVGNVTYNITNKTAIFTPSDILGFGTLYTATIKNLVKDQANNAMVANKVWTFTTISEASRAGPAPVRLGTAGNYVILAKTAITTIPASAITGDIGLSPAAESYLTGFSQTKATGYSTAPQVTGFIYAADMTPPTPSNMTTAISDMETAYTDAAGRSLSAVNDLGAGTVGGLTFAPGLYHWGSSVNVTTNITLNGGANDVWIFQMSGNLIVSSAVNVIMSGGAQAKNVFWQVAGYATLGTGSHIEGNILSQTQVIMETGASLKGRALAQTQVTLDQNAVTKPD
ncbi:MAG: ice-binding family protein, partial [Treponemataceae bacterium]